MADPYDISGDDTLTFMNNSGDDNPLDSDDPDGKGKKKQSIADLPQMKHQREIIPKRPRILRQSNLESVGKGSVRMTPGASKIP